MKNLATIIFISLFTTGLFSMVAYTSCKKTEQQEVLTCKNGGMFANGACNCPEGFEGKLCETKVDYCEKTGCQNGGACVGYCRCVGNYVGKYCEIDTCKSVICNNRGSCKKGVCFCASGYEGPSCDGVIREKFLGKWKYYKYYNNTVDSIMIVIDKTNLSNAGTTNVSGVFYGDAFSTVANTDNKGELQSNYLQTIYIRGSDVLSFSIAAKNKELEFRYYISGDMGYHASDTVMLARE